MTIESVQYLYHGSNVDFDEIDLSHTQHYKDYGNGYYLTTHLNQAQQWAQKKGKKVCYIYVYQIKDIQIHKPCILELLEYNEEWVDVITSSRIKGVYPEYDIIYDRIADNRFIEISDTLIKYSNKEITHSEVIDKVKWPKEKGDQFCFRTQKALDCLVLYEKFELRKSGNSWLPVY